MSEPKAMREIHRIRLKLYQEDKKLSRRERIRRTNKIAEEVLKRIGLEDKIITKVTPFK